jgi:hypothetical protein
MSQIGGVSACSQLIDRSIFYEILWCLADRFSEFQQAGSRQQILDQEISQPAGSSPLP